MNKNQNRFRVLLASIIFLVLVVAAVAGSTHYYSRQDPLMTVTSRGGMCDGPCNHSVQNLYNNGNFEGFKKLSKSEVADLKQIISSTDFTKYAVNPSPNCESFVDGSDQILLFPQKYGEKTFTTCMLDIPQNDKAYAYINKLLETHYIQQN